MADIKPRKSAAPAAPAKSKKAEENMTPQELEAKKAQEEAKTEEERQNKIKELIKSKKYHLPIK